MRSRDFSYESRLSSGVCSDVPLFTERLIRLSEVPRHLPRARRGRKVSIATIYRWALRGVRGVVLETWKAPSGKVTSLEAVERFFRELNGNKASGAASPSVARKLATRRAQVAKATLAAEFGLGQSKGGA